MKLLHFADLHLDSPFTWAGPELGRSRRRALRQVLQRIGELASSESVDAVLCAGDLYENECFTPDTTAFVADLFNELEVPVFLAPGNHDWLGPRSLYATASWGPNVHVFEENRLTPFALADGFTIWGAAHLVPANTPGFLEDFRVERAGVNIALFHGSEQGALMWQESGKAPHSPFREAQIAESGLSHAFVGHFHSPRTTRWYTYPGNPDPLTFGESGDRGVVIAEVDEVGCIQRTVHDVSLTRITDVAVQLQNIQHAGQIRDAVSEAVEPLTGIVRLTLNGEVAEEVDVRVEDLLAAGAHLEAFLPRVGDLTVAYDFEDISKEQTVTGQFVREVIADTSLDENERRRVLITGLRALSGRSDLEVQ